ncbi:MAG: aa3-type cytochrome c oxidase subunit IV [Hyphomonadaceae bacterium]|nr:aa3-type cytochrome c oxidase subunit IV [Hyphomonadaceae bacterium]
MAQSGAHDEGMNIDDQRATFAGFLTATVWTSAHVIQAVALLTLAFAIGLGWWAGVGAYIAIGVATAFLFKMGGSWWAAQVAQWVLLILGGLIVPALTGMMG